MLQTKSTTAPLLIAIAVSAIAPAAPALAGGGEHARTVSPSTPTDQDLRQLHELVQRARADLRVLDARLTGRELKEPPRARHPVNAEHGGTIGHEEHAEHGHAHGSGHAHGHGHGHEHGNHRHDDAVRQHREESGRRLPKGATWDETRNGVRLVLAFDSSSSSFKGSALNVTSRTLSDVRVEVHLSSGVELGPTRRVDVGPGKSVPVELSAARQHFSWWTTHAEVGNEEHHGSHHDHEGGEHGHAAAARRPANPALRPLFNQLLLLQQEIRSLATETSTGTP